MHAKTIGNAFKFKLSQTPTPRQWGSAPAGPGRCAVCGYCYRAARRGARLYDHSLPSRIQFWYNVNAWLRRWLKSSIRKLTIKVNLPCLFYVFQRRMNTKYKATEKDATMMVGTYGKGRVVFFFDRNTFFNDNGAGTWLERFDNKKLGLNMMDWVQRTAPLPTGINYSNQSPKSLKGFSENGFGLAGVYRV